MPKPRTLAAAGPLLRTGPSASDVARLAGVSQSAVSRVFTPGASASAKTREKVLAAARVLRYSPNAIAKGLITRKTNIVGLVLANFDNPFYSMTFAALTSRLQGQSKQVLTFIVGEDQSLDDLLPTVLSYQVDAIIIASATMSSAMAEECASRGTPVIMLNRYVPGSSTHTITADNFSGGVLAADLLVKGPHKTFGYVAGHSDTSTSVDRERGFHAGLAKHGFEPMLRIEGHSRYSDAFAAFARALANGKVPDAIFCANDIMALGVIDAAREARLDVPGKLSVVGFDDITQAGWGAYQLTTFAQPIDEMVSATVDLVLRFNEGDPRGRITHTFEPRLVVRNSAKLSALSNPLKATDSKATTGKAVRRK